MPLSAIFYILLYTNAIKNVSHSTVDQHYREYVTFYCRPTL